MKQQRILDNKAQGRVMVKQNKLCHLTKCLYYCPRRPRFGLIPLNEDMIVQHYIGKEQGQS